MDQVDLLGELTPPEEKKKADDNDKSIIDAVCDRGISYPAEIVGDTGINRQTCFDRIRFLAKVGRLERVFMRQHVPEELKARLSELWDMGLKGGMIKRMSWYRVPVGDDGGASKKKTA